MPIHKHADFEVPAFGEFAAPPVAAPAYAEAVLALGPLAYWRLGEASGTTLADQAGGHAMSLTGVYELGQPGGPATDDNRAARFSGGFGVTASAVVPTGAGDAFSIVFWLRAATPNTQDTAFMGQYAGGQPGRMSLTLMLDGTVRYATIGDAGFDTNSTVAGDWRMLVLTRDAAGNAGWYVDGQPDAEAAGQVTAILDTDFRLGKVLSVSPDVVLDEVAVFGDALTLDEVRWLYGLAVGRLALPPAT